MKAGVQLYLDKVDTHRKKSYKIYLQKNTLVKQSITPKRERPIKQPIHHDRASSTLVPDSSNKKNPYESQELLPAAKKKEQLPKLKLKPAWVKPTTPLGKHKEETKQVYENPIFNERKQSVGSPTRNQRVTPKYIKQL